MSLGSIIIAAHNEESVIARVLGHVADLAEQGVVDVLVVCNGCQDRTADIARGFPGVRVLELTQPSKAAALRAGERVAGSGPRIYLDADVELTGRAAVATLEALRDGALAGRPPRRFETDRAGRLVRRWYRIRADLPSVSRALWGAGCYALSPEGRSRFEEFPDVEADDLFIHSLFTPGEITIVGTDPVVVRTPRTLGDLLKIRRRAYRTQLPTRGGDRPVALSAGQQEQARELRHLVATDPRRLPDALVYASVIVLARIWARFGRARGWERDSSSREGD